MAEELPFWHLLAYARAIPLLPMWAPCKAAADRCALGRRQGGVLGADQALSLYFRVEDFLFRLILHHRLRNIGDGASLSQIEASQETKPC